MRYRSIGDREVSAIGLGAAGLTVADPLPPEEVVRVVQMAADAGITLVDTATCYIPSHEVQGYAEELIGRALRERGTEGVMVASKAGIERTSTVDFWKDFTEGARPETIVRQCETSLRALGSERIDLYQLHTPDPEIPIEETMGAFRELRDAGKIDLVGLCNVDLDQLDRALTVVEIASVQNKFSPVARESAPMIEACEERGIAFLPYSPLGGLGQRAIDMPAQAPAFARVAEARGVSPHRVALAWELARSPVVIPLPGARRQATIDDCAAAVELELEPDELELLDADLSPA